MVVSENAKKVLEKRYFKKDEFGVVQEDWEGLITRVARNIAGDNEADFQRFFTLLNSGAFLPNSPTLMNAGNDLQQLSACFVLPIEDSLDSIFSTIKDAAMIHKSGGGTGFNFSRLREENSRVKTTNGVSSGPMSFLRVFNSATDAVKQGGTRRGANMAILNVTHPQIIDFIRSKEDTSNLTNFNLSVGITDAFMKAVFADEEYELISPYKKSAVARLKAREVFSLIVEMAHKNGEPGIIFLDKINEHNPTPHIAEIESTNPCGEQPLLPYEACNLGSINLLNICRDNKIDWDYLKQIVRDSVDFLDCVIDKSKFPMTEIDEMVASNRKIGLGIMGWADLLFRLKISYGCDEAVSLAEDIMEFIDFHGKERSMELAIEKGAFPNFKGSIYDTGTVKRVGKNKDWADLLGKIQKNGIRNATVTTIAPTGTISMILNTSGGIEPNFSLVFVKRVMDNNELEYINHILQDALAEANLLDGDLMKRIADEGGLGNIENIPDEMKRAFMVSHEIATEWHLRMQAAFQKFTDNAVSKTINFPNSTTKEEIQMSFEMAWHLGCKGITVYRDGSRANQVLNIGKPVEEKHTQPERIAPRIRPEITSGITQRIETGCGHLYVTINSDDNGPCEIFAQMGKVGGCASAQMQSIARLASMLLRTNLKLESLIDQLKGIRCPSPMWHKGKMISSCADAIALSLETFLTIEKKGYINGTIKIDEIRRFSTDTKPSNEICDQCEHGMIFAEGCKKCSNPTCDNAKC
jgi:ribonucleoside-diphosphate reductase alpha chain